MLRAFLFLFIFPSAFAHAAGNRLSGWEAFSALQNGNMRFYEGHSTKQQESELRREGLAAAQNPHTIVISCSDSRVPPEILFDQGLGNLYVVRAAGNVVSAESIASIEYAVVHLGSKLLLVMGHESCDAVRTAVDSKTGVSNGSESLDLLVQRIRGHIGASTLAASATDLSLREPVKENVAATLKEVLRKSDIVTDAVRRQGLVLAQGIYSLKTGHVEFWDVGAKSDIVAAAAAGMPLDAPAIHEQQVLEEIIPERDVANLKKPKAKATSH